MISFEQALEQTNEIGTVGALSGSVALVSGLPQAKPGELIVFAEGQAGMVYALNQDHVEVLVLVENVPVEPGVRVARTGEPLTVGLSEQLLGKTLTAMGTMWGTGVEITGKKEARRVDQEPLPLFKRRGVTQPFATGVSVVDLLVPLGVGQRELVIGDHKVGKTQFLLQTLMSHVQRGGVGIYCGIAKRATEIASFQEFVARKSLEKQTILVFSGSAEPAGLIYLTPYTAMTIAEYFRDQKRDVLVIFDDLTIHAKYYREISLLAKRYPGRSAYPGDVFYVHAKLMERAGKFETGSITALPVAETVLGDISGYIQTNLMSMTDGHIFFDGELFNQGRRPAVNNFLSVTRVGHQTQTPLLRSLSRELSGFLVEHEKLKDLLHFGGELTDRVKKGLDKGMLLTAVFGQADDMVVPLPVSVLMVSLVWVEIVVVGDLAKVPALRKRLLEAYLADQGWQAYFDGLMQQNQFADVCQKVSADQAMLTPLLALQ